MTIEQDGSRKSDKSLGVDIWPGLYIVTIIIYREKFPLLSDIARRIYSLHCISASSAECERHFSAFNARHIISAQRNMHPETVEALAVVLEGYTIT